MTRKAFPQLTEPGETFQKQLTPGHVRDDQKHQVSISQIRIIKKSDRLPRWIRSECFTSVKTHIFELNIVDSSMPQEG